MPPEIDVARICEFLVIGTHCVTPSPVGAANRIMLLLSSTLILAYAPDVVDGFRKNNTNLLDGIVTASASRIVIDILHAFKFTKLLHF